MAVFWFGLGLILLLFGAELLVRGAASLAAAFGISPLVVGLTVVAFGTSAPELAVSLGAALGDRSGLAVGNVVGSNIFNILFILGLSAACAPLAVSLKLVRLEVPILMAISLLLVGLVWDGGLGPAEAWLLVGLGVAYIGFQFGQGRRVAESETELTSPKISRLGTGRSILWVALGLGMLTVGAGWLVDGAVVAARLLGISELVIGLTVIAAGTSLPELATSITAALKGQRDLAVGNVLGSNIFNILWVLGLVGVVSDRVPVAPTLWSLDLPVLVGAVVLCLPIFLTQFTISRGEGLFMVVCYLLYLVLQVSVAVESTHLGLLQHACSAIVAIGAVALFGGPLIQLIQPNRQ